MDQSAVQSQVLRLVVKAAGAGVAGIGLALIGFPLERLVQGDYDTWVFLGKVLLVGFGTGVAGWAQKWLADFSRSELPLELVAQGKASAAEAKAYIEQLRARARTSIDSSSTDPGVGPTP